MIQFVAGVFIGGVMGYVMCALLSLDNKDGDEESKE